MSNPRLPPNLFRRLYALASGLSVASAFIAGLVGAWATIHYGAGLAMSYAILTGNTEPRTPVSDYPWGWWGLGAAMTLAGVLLHRRRPLWGMGIMEIGAASTALIPFLHLYRLWKKT